MIDIGMIGLGKMGLSHMAIANMTPGLSVKAVADKSSFVCKAISKYTNIAVYDDYEKMINEEKLDAVIISLPNEMHYKACLSAIEKGLSFFVEKPFTLSPDESYEIINKAKEKSIFGQVGYVNRYCDVFKKTKSLLCGEAIGEIVEYRAEMLGNVITGDAKNTWRNNIAKGGGCLFDYGSHCIDLTIYLFGPIVSVEGATFSSVYSTGAEDAVSIICRHANGVVGNIHIDWCDKSQRKAYNEITIWGDTGKIVANKQEMKIYAAKPPSDSKLEKGWNNIFVTELVQPVPFYLRGEDFSNELLEFSMKLQNPQVSSISSIESAYYTDQAIELIRKTAKVARAD